MPLSVTWRPTWPIWSSPASARSSTDRADGPLPSTGTVTLATGIGEDVVRAANLNYRDPASIDRAASEADPNTFVEPHAGEVLYRLRTSKPGSAGR